MYQNYALAEITASMLLYARTSHSHPYTGTKACMANQNREVKPKQIPKAKPEKNPNDYFSVH